MMKSILQKVFAQLLVGMALFALLGCGGDLPDKDSNTMMPALSGNLIARFLWEQTATGYDSEVFTGYDGNLILKVTRLKDMDLERAGDYISSKLFVINSLYREIHSPYPGPLSNRIECAEEFKPVEVENSPFNYYLIYATDRFTYGVCSWDLITYRTVLHFLHCENEGNLYQIELFVPLNEYTSGYENSLKEVGCASPN